MPSQLFNMTESVLERTLDDDVHVDNDYVSASNISSESGPIVQQIGQIPPEMILQDRVMNRLKPCDYFK